MFAGQKRTLWATIKLDTERVGKLGVGSFSVAYKHQDRPQLVAADPLSQLECVADRERFERSVQREVWEEAVLKNKLSQNRVAMGKAIAEGSEKDVGGLVSVYEENRQLAERLGSTAVLDSLNDVQREARDAKAARAGPADKRGVSAKRAKASGIYGLRGDAYREDPAAALRH